MLYVTPSMVIADEPRAIVAVPMMTGANGVARAEVSLVGCPCPVGLFGEVGSSVGLKTWEDLGSGCWLELFSPGAGSEDCDGVCSGGSLTAVLEVGSGGDFGSVYKLGPGLLAGSLVRDETGLGGGLGSGLKSGLEAG